MKSRLDRMIYIDDSGHPQAGDVTYGWIAFDPNSWSDVLGCWLECRKLLWRKFRIPVTDELHTTDYVNGRGKISKKPPEKYIHGGQTYWKDLGQDVARTCLETLSSTRGLYVGAIGAQGDPKELARTKKNLYAHLLNRLEADLHERDGLGMVFIDGDGNDTSYRICTASCHAAVAGSSKIRSLKTPRCHSSYRWPTSWLGVQTCT